MKKVLIANEDKYFVGKISKEIEKRDFKVIGVAFDGADAITKISELKPDVVILDIVMSKIDGIGVLERLCTETKVIIVSDCLTTQIVKICMSLGAIYYMRKSCSAEDIADRVDMFSKDVIVENNCIDISTITTELMARPKNTISSAITDIMHRIGISANLKGHRYLRRAIELTYNDPDVVLSITKELYPSLAKEFGTTPSRVERAIRHAIEKAFTSGDKATLKSIFGNSLSKDKSTNSEFIAMVADQLRMNRMTA